MKIIVDAMGGDNSIEATVNGSIGAVRESDLEIVLIGKKDLIEKELNKSNYDGDRIEIIHTEEVITNNDSPTLAIRRKKNSSIVVGFNKLNEGYGEAFISSGNTGSLLAGGLFLIKRIKGIDRAAISSLYPTRNGMTLLLDMGANVDCKPEYLKQFAIMGSTYSEKILGISSPTVGLVNVGTEKEKGNTLVKEAYELLSNSDINFYGNIEARDIPEGIVDVMVCDGFVGNVVLKLTEGIANLFFSTLKEEFTKKASSKFAALMLKPQLKSFKERFDYREYGGAPLLGIKKPVIKAHGSSDAFAIKNAIKQAKIFTEKKVIDKIEENINKY